MIGMPVLIGGNSSVFAKYFYEVAAVIKPTLQADIRNGQVGSMQHLGCLLDPVVIHVIKWCLMGEGTEKAAEILGIHAGFFGKQIQGNRGSIVGFYIFQNGF